MMEYRSNGILKKEKDEHPTANAQCSMKETKHPPRAQSFVNFVPLCLKHANLPNN